MEGNTFTVLLSTPKSSTPAILLMDPPSTINLQASHTDTDLLLHYPGSSITLRFEDQKLEEAYKAQRNTKQPLGYKVQFSLVFYLVLLFEAVAAAGRYGETSANSSLLYTQLVVLGILAVIGGLCLLLVRIAKTARNTLRAPCWSLVLLVSLLWTNDLL